MPTRSRTRLHHDAARASREQLARLGLHVRQARSRRRLTQAQLGARVGLSQPTVSRLENGNGGGLTLDAWQRVAVALGTRLVVSLPRDPVEEPADAGHLALQELVLREGRRVGFTGQVELPTRPNEPWRSADVALVDDAHRRLLVVECWNTVGDVGAGARSSNRKLAEAHALAAARWGEGRYHVALVWVVRSTARNRALLARYPELFAARFPGSSAAWVHALTVGTPPPSDAGIVWAATDGSRLFPWRRRHA